MPIVIARNGPVEPVVTGIKPEQRQAAWAHIVRTWADRNPDRLTAAAAAPVQPTNTGKEENHA